MRFAPRLEIPARAYRVGGEPAWRPHRTESSGARCSRGRTTVGNDRVLGSALTLSTAQDVAGVPDLVPGDTVDL